jgi:arsenite methyltransferase
MTAQELEVRKAVKERYAKLANSESCCDPGACCGNQDSLVNIPSEASSINASCGSPVSLIFLKEGDVVVDLGSGGGIDVFRASPLVGKSGKAIGVDATPEMIWRARETAMKYKENYPNAEFRLGEIEHLPIESNTADYVISNCVINLSPNKQQVFNEAFRALKPNGQFVVADITVNGEVPESARNDMSSWSECISGAISDSDYKSMLASSGFVDIKVEEIPKSEQEKTSKSLDGDAYPFEVSRNHIRARKPRLILRLLERKRGDSLHSPRILQHQ